MEIQQPIQLPTHRNEPPGLDLDQQPVTDQIDDESLQRSLYLVAIAPVPLLERGMEWFLIQETDRRHRARLLGHAPEDRHRTRPNERTANEPGVRSSGHESH